MHINLPHTHAYTYISSGLVSPFFGASSHFIPARLAQRFKLSSWNNLSLLFLWLFFIQLQALARIGLLQLTQNKEILEGFICQTQRFRFLQEAPEFYSNTESKESKPMSLKLMLKFAVLNTQYNNCLMTFHA